MFFRVVSDLHLEFSQGHMNLPESSEDKETVLVLAGDIGMAKRATTYRPFIEKVAPRFRDVIFILGNHEHYKGHFPTSHTRIWNELVEFDNVHVIEKECLVIDNVAFVCATLWTDMNNHDPMCVEQVRFGMNDYNLVRNGPIEEPWKKKLHQWK